MAEPAGPLEVGSTRSGLTVVRAVLDELDAAGVRYCHWKSNEHLLAALDGMTDLDLLVDDADGTRFRDAVARHGFVHARNAPIRRIDGLEDHLGMDDATGTLVHLHVHFRLVIGERHVKDHHLPIESWLLAGLVRRHDVPIPSPDRELLLLYLRCVLKSDLLTSVHLRLRGRTDVVPEPIRAELRELLASTTDDDVVDALRGSKLPLDAARLRGFLDRARTDRLTGGYLALAKHDLRSRLRAFERHRHGWAVLRRLGYRLRFDSRVQNRVPVRRKSLAGGGLYVAVVGADGSGKSRLVADLVGWLGRKLDTSTVYFGQPKRHRRLIALRRARKVAARRSWVRLDAALDAVSWLYIARLRRGADRLARARRARARVVVAERFPLADFAGMAVPMDGPRLGAPSGGGVSRWLSGVEGRQYARIREPDLVLALTASLPTLRRRKPLTDPEEHAAKATAVRQLTSRGRLVTIDAEQPYPNVLLAAKRHVWSALRQAQSTP